MSVHVVLPQAQSQRTLVAAVWWKGGHFVEPGVGEQSERINFVVFRRVAFLYVLGLLGGGLLWSTTGARASYLSWHYCVFSITAVCTMCAAFSTVVWFPPCSVRRCVHPAIAILCVNVACSSCGIYCFENYLQFYFNNIYFFLYLQLYCWTTWDFEVPHRASCFHHVQYVILRREQICCHDCFCFLFFFWFSVFVSFAQLYLLSFNSSFFIRYNGCLITLVGRLWWW